MKRTLIITLITIVCLLAIYIYITTSNGIYYGRMHYRYNKVITEPLAKMGVTNAQYQMGLYWFNGSGEQKIPKEELEKAVYWWGKAAAKGSKEAITALAEAKKYKEVLRRKKINR